MPFTPSHAVVALPFLRTPLVPGAIAIGSMTPDVPLFFPVGPDYWFTHSWPGALVADLPIAAALLLLWRILLRPAVPQLTSRWLAERWPASWTASPADAWRELTGTPANHISSANRIRPAPEIGRPTPIGPARHRICSILLVLASLALGIATHLVWDDFTHPGRWGSLLIPALDDRLGPFLIAEWAHYLSSVFGLAIIAAWGIRWLRHRMPQPPRSVPSQLLPAPLRIAAWIAVPSALLLATVVALLVYGVPHDPVATRILIERAGKGGAAVILVFYAAMSVTIALLAGAARRRHARDPLKFGGPPNAT